MLNNSRILIELDGGGSKTMRQFTKDPGGHKVTDPGGWKAELDPGTGI